MTEELFDADDVGWSGIDAPGEMEYAVLYTDRPKYIVNRLRSARRAAQKVVWWRKLWFFIRGFLKPDSLIAHWELEQDGTGVYRPVRMRGVEISDD